jgi:hypothetical protein
MDDYWPAQLSCLEMSRYFPFEQEINKFAAALGGAG